MSAAVLDVGYFSSLAALQVAYPATGSPQARGLTGDYGQVVSNGTSWSPIRNQLISSAVPVGVAPSGSVSAGSSGQLSLGSNALDQTYAWVYLYFPNHALQYYITFGTITGGSGYVSGTYTGVPLTSGSANGAGAQATIVVTGGVVTSVTLTYGGNAAYAGTDTFSASNANLGGSGSGFSVGISSIKGSQPGCYLVAMSSTTAGTVYNYVYGRGQPAIPASPTALVCTGQTYGQVTGQTLYLFKVPIPANSMGPNGELEVEVACSNSNSTTGKRWYIFLGGQAITAALVMNTSGAVEFSRRHRIVNRGVTNSQYVLNSAGTGAAAEYGDPGPGNATNLNLTVDTTLGQTLTATLSLDTTGNDWGIVQSISVVAKSSALIDYPPPMVFIPSGASRQPAGAAALGYGTNQFYKEPQVSDIDFTATGTSLSLFPGLWYQTPPVWTNSSGANPPYATNVTISGKSVLCLSQKGDGVTPGLATQNANSAAGAIPYLYAANGFYFEWSSWLSGEDPDHWAALWALPQEHRTTGGGHTDVTAYVELDVDEIASAVAGPGGYNSNTWQDSTVINWTGGPSFSPVDYQNSFSMALLGLAIDRTKEHIFGISYDPTNKILQTWLDGAKTPFSKSTASFDSNINPYHYYLIMGPQQRGGQVPYNMYIRYFSGWTP